MAGRFLRVVAGKRDWAEADCPDAAILAAPARSSRRFMIPILTPGARLHLALPLPLPPGAEAGLDEPQALQAYAFVQPLARLATTLGVPSPAAHTEAASPLTTYPARPPPW